MKLKNKKINLSRPPVVTLMGHIDHGKTSLLDVILKTNQTQKESGGITQHINAFKINYQGNPITFIDTPGHAAFSAMRSRGCQVTDIVILVIDAVEGVKPQTKEAIKLIKESKIPIIVAINKIDLPGASPDRVKKELADNQISVEGFGGKHICVEVSAKTKKGISELLEMILLLAQMIDLKNPVSKPLKAVIIESHLDLQKGPLATVIVRQGTLKINQTIQAENAIGKIKALFNPFDQKIIQASPGQPAKILGFKTVPPVGSLITSSKNLPKTSAQIKTSPNHASNNDQKLNLILKADTTGTLEAILKNLPDDVFIIKYSVGEVNESDIILAQSTKAQIISFQVPVSKAAQKLASIEKITILKYQIIYKLLEDLAEKVLKLLEPTIDEQQLGTAKIIAQFNIKGQQVAGCQVLTGKLQKGNLVHLVRNQKSIKDSAIKSLQQNKKEVDTVKANQECGLTFTTQLDFKLKDQIIAYQKIS